MVINDLNTKTVGNPAWVALDDGNGDTYKANFPDVVADAAEEAVQDIEISNNTVMFTSSDVADGSATSWTSVTTMTTGETLKALFAKVSQMFKNIRYLYKMLGTTNISSIGNGTVTGALSTLNSKLTKTNLSSQYTNSLSTNTDGLSIIKNGNIAHVVIAYPSISINNDTQVGVLPSEIKSSATSIFKVVNRTSGVPISGTCWVSGGVNAIRYYGTNISSTRIMIEGIISLDT